MKLDFSQCKTPADVDRVMEKARPLLVGYRRVLIGFAHYDKGVKVPGCDCCYCSPVEPANE